ncbi:hypothetical protein ACNOYE_33210 [Nannocystaceae bacterium ST9]
MASSLATLDALLGRPEPLDTDECLRLVEALDELPGRSRRVVERLATQRDAAAVEALLRLPSGTAGVIEGLFAALRRGVARPRVDGLRGDRMLAIEFRRSDARRFADLLARAELAFGGELEHLHHDRVALHRVALFERPGTRASLRRRAREHALELEVLHRSLLRLRGVRVWINGWRFDDDSSLRPPARVPLLRAWLDWASAEDPPA